MSYGTPPPNEPYGQPPTPTQPSAKGFFGSLFDFGFNHFVTPIIVKVVYVLALVALVIGWLVWLGIGFSQGVGYGVVVLVLGAIGVLVYLCLIRMTLEFYLAIIRMSEDIHHRLR